MKKHYTQAITELLLQGSSVDAVLEKLERVLKSKGHQRIHRDVLKGVQTSLERLQEDTAPQVTVAAEKDRATMKEAIDNAITRLGGDSTVATVATDQTLIGGFVVTHNGRQINSSYKQKLVTLYRSITK